MHSHEIARAEDVVRRPLSSSRVRTFKEATRKSIFEAGDTERLFTRAGALSRLGPEDADAPTERGFNHTLTKDAFTDQPSTGPFSDLYVADYDPHLYGVETEHDVRQRFSKVLSAAPVIEMALDIPEAMLRAIDRALEALACPKEAIVLLTGDWNEARRSFDIQPPANYEPWGAERLPYYRGHPILYPFNPPSGGRKVYVVEPGAWGSLLRAQFGDGSDLRVDIILISAAQAQGLLNTHPDLFSEEADASAKLRKIQTLVQCIISIRSGFRVTTMDRARQIREPATATTSRLLDPRRLGDIDELTNADAWDALQRLKTMN